MMNLSLMQALAQLGATNPQLLAKVAASSGMQPPEPGAPGGVGTPGTPGTPPVGQQMTLPGMGAPAAQPMDFASALTGVGAPTLGAGAQPLQPPPPPGAPSPRQGGSFSPQILEIMQAMMANQPQPGNTSLSQLIRG